MATLKDEIHAIFAEYVDVDEWAEIAAADVITLLEERGIL